ncbi:MAG: hypothetical protein FWD92_00390 [Methanomassiliicoccaceae archaeon]|nr:hypothetical protein [Methanomassiliicoccaceae archaeon]
MDMLTLAGFAIMTASMISASIQDVRSREVSDAHWALICGAGMMIMIIRMFDGNVSMERMMMCAGTAMIIADILYDRKFPLHLDVLFYITIAMMFIIPVAVSSDDVFVKTSALIPVCYIMFAAMFHTGVIKGGADVKCLISAAIVFPVYPEMFVYPIIDTPSVMSLLMPFPVAMLFLASLFSVSAMVFVFVRNIIRGDTEFPNMFLGYTMDSGDTCNAHVWIMDSAHDTDLNERIWVTPKIPFIVPLTAALLFIVLAGNPVFLFI